MDKVKSILREALLTDDNAERKEKVLQAYEYILTSVPQAVVRMTSYGIDFYIPKHAISNVLGHKSSGDKIYAIKYLRDLMHDSKMGLRETKDIVEQIWEKGVVA